MSTIMRKKFKSPEDLKKKNSAEYNDILKKALRQLTVDIPNPKEDKRSRFFYVLDFPFLDGEAPMVWLGPMTAIWKKYYKQNRKKAGFAAGVAEKTVSNHPLTKKPFLFTVEEGKGIKKGFVKQIIKAVKRATGKQIDILGMLSKNGEDNELSDELGLIESSDNSVFARLRQAIVNYKNIDSLKSPLAKAEARQTIESLLTQWEKNTIKAEKTSDQKKFIKNFQEQFNSFAYLYRDRVAELHGLYKGLKSDFSQYSVDKKELAKTYKSSKRRAKSNNYPRILREHYTELLELQKDLEAWIKLHVKYFDKENWREYDAIPIEDQDRRRKLKSAVKKMQEAIAKELQEVQAAYQKRKGNEIKALDLGLEENQLEVPKMATPSEQIHPAIAKDMNRFNELLHNFGDNMEVGANVLQNKLMDISDNIYIREQQIKGKNKKYLQEKAALREKINDTMDSIKATKYQDQINILDDKLEALQKEQEEFNLAHKEIYNARKGLGASGFVDAGFERILDLFDAFNNDTARYAKSYGKNIAEEKRKKERVLRHKIQDRIDWLEAEIQSWQEDHIDLDRSETKTKNKQLQAIRKKIKTFVSTSYVGKIKFSFDYKEGEFKAPRYIPEEDTRYTKYIRGLVAAYDQELKNQEASLLKKDRHWNKDKDKYYKERQRLTQARIKKLRGYLEKIGGWQLHIRPYEESKRLKGRQDRVKAVEDKIHQELKNSIALQNTDLISKNAAKANKKFVTLDKEQQKLKNSFKDLMGIDVSSLSPKKLKAHEKEVLKTSKKLQKLDAQMYRQTLNTLEGVQASNSYLTKLIDGNPDKETLMGNQMNENNELEEANKKRLQSFWEDLESRFDKIMLTSAHSNPKATIEQLKVLEQNISILYIGMEKAQKDHSVLEIETPEKIQALLLTVQKNIEVLSTGDSVSLNFFLSIKKEGKALLNMGAEDFGKNSGAWAKAAKMWMADNASIKIPRVETQLAEIEKMLKKVLKKSKSDDIKAFQLKKDLETALEQSRTKIGDLETTFRQLAEDDSLNLENELDSLDAIKREHDQLLQKSTTVESLEDTSLLLIEIINKLIFNLDSIKKELLLKEANSPDQLRKEKETFAALNGNFDLFHNRGFVIPPDELKQIQEVGKQVTDRVNGLIKLGASPEELEAQLSHVPYTLWPDTMIKEMQEFKRVRAELLNTKIEESAKDLSSDQWNKQLDKLVSNVKDPNKLQDIAKTLYESNPDLQTAFGLDNSNDFVKFALGDLKLNEDGDAKKKQENIDLAVTIIKTVQKIAAYTSKGIKKGDKLFGEENTSSASSAAEEALTPVEQTAKVLGGVTKILKGAVTIAKLCQDDPSRNPQQEFNNLINKYWDGCSAAYTIGAGVVGIISAFQDGLDQVASAFGLGLGVFKMAKGITTLMEHKRMHGKTKKLHHAANVEGDALMYAMHQEMGNLNHQMKRDKIDIAQGALLTAGGAVDTAGLAIGVGGVQLSAKTAKAVNKVIDYAWKGYEMKVKGAMIKKTNTLLGQAAAGNRDVVGQIYANSPYFAKMLVACRMHEGDFLAQQYCIQRGIAPEDLDNEFYSKKILFEFLIKDSGEKESSAVDKALLGSQLKIKANTGEEFVLPREAPEGIKEWFSQLGEDAKDFAKDTYNSMLDLPTKIEDLYTSIKDKASEKLVDFKLDAKMALGIQVNDYENLLREKKIETQKLVELIEDYNKLRFDDKKLIAYFKKKGPYNKLKSIKKALTEYKGQLILQKQNIENELLNIIDLADKTKLMELIEKMNTSIREIQVVENLYETYDIN